MKKITSLEDAKEIIAALLEAAEYAYDELPCDAYQASRLLKAAILKAGGTL